MIGIARTRGGTRRAGGDQVTVQRQSHDLPPGHLVQTGFVDAALDRINCRFGNAVERFVEP